MSDSSLWVCFNPRTPCGVRLASLALMTLIQQFQSTHSLRSATLKERVDIGGVIMFQSTHSLRSATLLQHLQFQSLSVSIHALLAECDPHDWH